MNKNKIVLPVLAFVFAFASAFATSPFAQTGWVHVPPNTNAEGTINNTDKPCLTGRAIICRIGDLPAYDSPTSANAQNSNGILKYNP